MWETLPHSNFGGIRFNINSVWEFLENADEGKGRDIQGPGETDRVSPEDKDRVQDLERGKGVGTSNVRTFKKASTGKQDYDMGRRGRSLVNKLSKEMEAQNMQQ